MAVLRHDDGKRLSRVGESLCKKFVDCAHKDISGIDLEDLVATEAVAIAIVEYGVNPKDIEKDVVDDDVMLNIYDRSDYLIRRFVTIITTQREIFETNEELRRTEDVAARNALANENIQRVLSMFENIKWMDSLLYKDDTYYTIYKAVFEVGKTLAEKIRHTDAVERRNVTWEKQKN